MAKEIIKEMLDALDEEKFWDVWWDFCTNCDDLDKRVYKFDYQELISTPNIQKALEDFDYRGNITLRDIYSSIHAQKDGDLLKAIIEGKVNPNHKYIVAINSKLYTSDSARELAKMTSVYDEDMILEYVNEEIESYKEIFNIRTKYLVEVQVVRTYYVDVEALDEDDAEQVATDIFERTYDPDCVFEYDDDELVIADVSENE